MASSQPTLKLLLSIKEQGAEAIVRARKGLEQLAEKTLQAAQANRQEAQAAAQADTAHRKIAAGVQSISTQLQRVQQLFLAWQGSMAALSGARQIVELADAWASLQSRLKLATAGQQEYATAQRETFAIAQRLGASVAETTTLYGKLQSAVRALGGTQQDALGLTESIGQALRISGASAGGSAAALLQFGQALASGALRGDEFNSVMESAPRLAKALADGLGVSTGKLRQMAEAGQLTADVVVKALQSQSGALQAEFDQLPRTVGQSLTALGNAFMKWIGGLNEATGATGKLAAALGFVADHLQAFATVLTALAAGALLKISVSLLPQLIAALRTAGLTAAATGVKIALAFKAATLPIEFATAVLGRFNVALSAVGAVVAGWQVGTYLRENFKPIAALGDVIGASIGALVGAISATFTLIVDLVKGPQNAVAQFGLTLKSLGAAWVDVSTQARIALMGTESLVNAQGASLEELQARISAVRLALAESVSNGMQAVADATARLDAVINKIDQDAAKAQSTVNAALSGIAAVRQAQAAAIDQALAEQTAGLDRHLQQQKALLDQQTVSEQQRIAAETQLVIERYTKEAELDRQAAGQKLQLLQQETAARLAAAAADGKTLEERRAAALKAEEDILAGQRNVWAQAAASYQQHIDALIGEENRHLQAVQQVEQARLGINASIEDKIRELQRQTLSSEEALQDRKTQIAQLQAKAREAIAKGEFDKAQEYANKSIALAETVGRNRGQEGEAIAAIRSAQTMLNQALDGEAAAHQKAAAAAKDARTALEGQIATARSQVEDLNKAIAEVQAVKIEVDTSRIPAALDEVQRLIAERDTLLPIQADLRAAQQKLQEFDAALKAGKSITIDADITKGQAALDKLQAYAKAKANVDLQLSTAAAQGRIADLETRITTLNKLETASQHVVKDNVPQVKREIDSLQGRNTSSTHTITVRRVEARAAGGLVGALAGGVRRFAKGGSVAAAFPRMTGGTVPGSGNGDTVPRTLEAGAFVIRKAAVQKYGSGTLARLASGVAHFASGGPVGVNKDVYEAGAMINLGLQAIREYVNWMRAGFGFALSPSFAANTHATYDAQAAQDRMALDALIGVQRPDGAQSAMIERIKKTWRSAMDYVKLWGGSLDDELQSLLEGAKATFFARGGLAKSDTVPAMLTPGEYVVNKEAVARYGVGFFEAINSLKAPAQALAGRALAGIQGFASGGLVQPASSGLPRPSLPDAAPIRTVRVELASGQRTVHATIDARDEARLLQLLDAARLRTA